MKEVPLLCQQCLPGATEGFGGLFRPARRYTPGCMGTPIRKARRAWNEPGHAHFVTYSCFRRLPLRTRPRTRAWVSDAIGRARCTQDVAIWGYVIMPEHVHVLLCPLRWPHAMRTILAALKRPVAQAARVWLVQTGALDGLARLTVRYPGRDVFRFWQPGGGYDHNIVEERSGPTILEYMHANPVRRELVKSPTEWEWSSARFWEGDRNVPLLMDHPDTTTVHEETKTLLTQQWHRAYRAVAAISRK